MKKFFKKTLSLMLAVSALCILFAFQASAVTTQCPDCGSSLIYYSLGNVSTGNTNVYHHEVYCTSCSWGTEEGCDFDDYNSTSHWCICGETHSHDIYRSDGYYGHTYYCSGCAYSYFTSHVYLGGYCIICGAERPVY